MTDIFGAVGVLIPSLAALLIAAFALRRSASDAEEARRSRGEMGLRQEINLLRDETKELKKELRDVKALVEDLRTELSTANMKLLRQLLKENGGKQ